ncbi:hypothetical protein KY338_01125 [Candidatus Woesearchaeota archaeon]|nr:hypothetical protein [Candidatus Woesearchaeota archaeon]MBW3006010.1 hypothetical protein [Candidatus Woesearchaeota archaeon]
MSDAEHEFIFGQEAARNFEKIEFGISNADFYDAEEALHKLEQFHKEQGIPLPDKYNQLVQSVRALALPALTAQAQALFEREDYRLALATLKSLQSYCVRLNAPLPEEAEDLAAELAEHRDELPDIPEEYKGDQIIAFFKMPDGLCQYELYTSVARLSRTLKNTNGKYIGAFAGVNTEFIERAIMRTRHLSYPDVDKVELSDILEE